MEDTRVCNDCKGQGEHVHAGFTSLEGQRYPERRYACHTCDGARVLGKPDLEGIFAAVTTARGASKGKRKFRSSPPEAWRQSNRGIENRRAYFVWRLARFHGGADVTLPMTADTFLGGDPYKPELDAYASVLAGAVFGYSKAGARRWARALGRDVPHEAGEPDSALSCGPVADSNKPSFESLELK